MISFALQQCITFGETMADYRRAYQPGGTFFFTLVTYERFPLFTDPASIQRLRNAVLAVMNERPFEFLAGVVLPDHAHYLWTLPPGDSDFSTRIGRMKVLFTKNTGWASSIVPSPSRRKHREANIWQRRFWEHTIRDEADLNRHLDYIHYNPVRHGLATCPHAWPASSFNRWVAKAAYTHDWFCQCNGRTIQPPDFTWATDDME